MWVGNEVGVNEIFSDVCSICRDRLVRDFQAFERARGENNRPRVGLWRMLFEDLDNGSEMCSGVNRNDRTPSPPRTYRADKESCRLNSRSAL